MSLFILRRQLPIVQPRAPVIPSVQKKRASAALRSPFSLPQAPSAAFAAGHGPGRFPWKSVLPVPLRRPSSAFSPSVMPQDEKRRLHGLAQADALSGTELFHWNRPAFSPNHSLLVRPHQLLCESFRPLKTSPDITEKQISTEKPRSTECYAGPQVREETVSRYISRCHKSRYRWKRASRNCK